MAVDSSDILLPAEIEHYIENLCPSTMEELGSKKWLEKHGRLQKLNQQAVLEANKMKDELVKNTFILFEKIPVIVYEGICTTLWRKNVLPKIVKLVPNPKSNFLVCSILYHEATVVGLLAILLYHEESCETLGECVIDLIDYCINSVTYCISREKVILENPACGDGNGDHLMYEENRLKFDNGIRSVAILRCLGEYLESLPLSAASRIYETHDLPLIFVELIENPPWYAKDKEGNTRLYKDGRWLSKEETKLADDGSVQKIEAQVWLGLVMLLLGQKCQSHYEINNFRKNVLLKLQRYLHDELLDQLSPLIELQRWLSHLAVSQPPVITRQVVLEVVPEIHEALATKYSKKWRKLAEMQAKTLCNPDRNDIEEIAKSLSEVYDLDVLLSLLPNDSMCANGCGSKGMKRCSRCKAEWYCGRECQVNHWAKHKAACDLLGKMKENQ